MPSPTLQRYRQALAEAGVTDDRDDDFIIEELGQEAERTNPSVFDSDADFARRYREIREANAPSMAGEVGRGLKRGGLGLLSTGAGGMSLFTGDGWLREKSRELEQAAGAPELRSTVPTLEDIAPGEQSTTGKVFSRDALRYAAAKFGEAAPSIVEAVGTGVAGALAGSAAAPGPGTIAGAAGGFLGRSMVRKAIRELTEKGVKELTPDLVAATARKIGARAGGTAAAAVNSYVLNAGDVLSEIPDNPALAAGMGVISAIPDTILPMLIVRRLFPGVQVAAAKEAAKEMVADRAIELGKKLGLGAGAVAGEGATEWFQEAVNVVARNIEAGVDPLEFSDADFKRFREAGITGMAGGLLAAPAVALGGQPTEVAPGGVPPATPEVPPATSRVAPVDAPAAPPLRTNAQIFGQIELMTDEEKLARIAELQAKGELAADEQTELDLLLAESPVAPAAAVTTPPPASPVIPQTPAGAPPSIGLPGQEIEFPETPAQPAPGLVEPVPTPEQDYARYQEIQAAWKAALAQPGFDIGSPEMQALWAENEEIKNRYGGMPPPAPATETITDAPLRQAKLDFNPEDFGPPDDGGWHQSHKVAGAFYHPQTGIWVSQNYETRDWYKWDQASSAWVPYESEPSEVTKTAEPAPSAPEIAAPPTPAETNPQLLAPAHGLENLVQPGEPPAIGLPGQEIEETDAPPVAPPVEQPTFTRAQIVEQRRLVKELRQKAERATDPKRAKKFSTQLAKELTTLNDMVENKLTGRAPTVGNGPDGEPDLLTNIAGRIGKIRTVPPAEGNSTKGGEYNGWNAALAYGAAKMLNGGEDGVNPDEVFSYVNDYLGYNFQTPGDLQDAISKASEKRKSLGAELEVIKYQQGVELAFMENKGRPAKLKAKNPTPIEDIGVGGKFRIDDEKFSVVDVLDAEDREDGRTIYIVKDGHRFEVPEGALVFPDRGTLKKAKKDLSFGGTAAESLTPENAPKPEELKPIVPSAAIVPPPVTPIDQKIDKQADDAKKILAAAQAAIDFEKPTAEELRGQKVRLEAVTPEGRRVEVEMDAADAWADTQSRRKTFRMLLECLKGPT